MKTVWQTSPDGPVCTWCPSDEEVRDDLGLIDDSEDRDAGSYLAPNPDFSAHSPLGSGEWFAPWDMRWSLPHHR